MDLASDGVEALDAARRLGALLGALVTDLNMPRMGGEDLIHALRADRPLPVVVVTGAPPSGGEEALRQCAGGYGPLFLVHKPVECAKLAAALQRATARTAVAPVAEPAAVPAPAIPKLAPAH